MFGDRGPLYEEVKNEWGGGVGDVLGKIVGGAKDAATGLTLRPTQAGFANAIPETEEVPPDTVRAPVGAGERQGGSGQSGVVMRPAAEHPEAEAPKGAKSLVSVSSTQTPGLTLEEQALEAEANARIFQAKRATTAAELQAMGLATTEMAQFANIGAMDAIEGQRLHDEHFVEAKRRTDNLYRQIDDARSLKVNPFNWHQSIGRGGRVAAAFSLLTGQMAAGAGNPNSALKMMDSAIERDISAQEQNIKNEYENLKLTRGLNQDERKLHEEEIASLNSIRALKYSAMLGRIGAAKQHAITEGAYQAYTVMEEHYVLKQLEAIRAERARILSVYLKGPIQDSMLRQIQKRVTEIGKQLVPGTQIQGAPGAAPVEQSATTALPSAPGRAGSVGGRTGRPAPKATPPTSGAQSGDVGVEPTPATDDSDRPDWANVPSTEAEALARQPDAPSPTREGTRAFIEANVAGDPKVAKRIAEYGGYGRDTAAANNYPKSVVASIPESLEAYARGENLPLGGFADDRDAQLFAALIKERPPLRKNFDTDRGFAEARRQHEFQTNHYEVFEQEGVQNTIDTGGGYKYRVKATSPLRRTDSTGTTKYYETVAKLVEGREYSDKLMQIAEDYVRVGPGSGFFNAKEGAFSLPGWNSTDPGTKLMAQGVTRLAMGFIKSEDPTARLSDKDLEVGQAAMGLEANGVIKLLDIVESLDGKYDNNTVRTSMERYLRRVAVMSQTAYYKKYANDLVPSYATSQQLIKDADKKQKWLNTIPDEEKN